LYDSEVNYLMKYRLQWGKPDTLSLLQSSLDWSIISGQNSRGLLPPTSGEAATHEQKPSVTTADDPNYFTASTPSELISIILNDWPYSGWHLFYYMRNCPD
jgi:hypothetical protein